MCVWGGGSEYTVSVYMLNVLQIILLTCCPLRYHHWMKFPFIIWNLTVLWSFVAWFRICLTLSFTWESMKPLTETQKHVYVLLFSWNFLLIISDINFIYPCAVYGGFDSDILIRCCYPLIWIVGPSFWKIQRCSRVWGMYP